MGLTSTTVRSVPFPINPSTEADAFFTFFLSFFGAVDPTLSADEVKTLYWASQYDRLSSLRAKYDPGAVFKNPQSIIAA